MQYRYRKVLDRRTVLRGAGTVAISLPFLEEMTGRSQFAAAAEVPPSYINIFFGQGIPKDYTQAGLVGAMEPYAGLADKMAFYDGIEMHPSGPGGTHSAPSVAAYTAMPGKESQSGGPSLDQIVKRESYPNGRVPGVKFQNGSIASYFRRDRKNRYIHNWGYDGAPVEEPQEHADRIFKRYFGDTGAPSNNDGNTEEDLAARRKRAYRSSVLDAVVKDYTYITGPASGLTSDSKERVRKHLEKIRELEMSMAGNENVMRPGLGGLWYAARSTRPKWVSSGQAGQRVP